MSTRSYPNIIVTGTPGCGKTSHCENLVSQLGEHFRHLCISELAKERNCIESYDEVLDTSVVDEEKLLDSLEPDLEKGGVIVDWHCCDLFPERLIDLVVVLRTENGLLFDRMKKRGYKDNKIQENLDCEIMEVIVQEARDSFEPEIVIELSSNTADEMEENVERIGAWIEIWGKDHPNGVHNELQDRSDESDENDDEEDSEIENEV